jgi:hypothetical protein
MRLHKPHIITAQHRATHHSSAARRDDRTMEADKWEKPFYIRVVVTFSRTLLFYFSKTSHSAHVSVRRKVQGVTATWAGAVCLVPGYKLETEQTFAVCPY